MGLQSDKMASRMKRSFSGVASTLRTIRKIATVAFAAVGLSATLMIGSVARDFANWDKIWPFFDKGIQGMKDGMIAFLDLVMAGWDKLAGLGEPIKQAFSTVMGYFKPFQDAIVLLTTSPTENGCKELLILVMRF